MPVVGPAIMPVSWDSVAHRFASFGAVDQCQPEQRRNRKPRSGLAPVGYSLLCPASKTDPVGTELLPPQDTARGKYHSSV